MEYTNIIKTDIISNNYDVLWDDVSESVNDAIPKPVLILVNKCEEGSNEDVQLRKMLDACKLTNTQYNIIRLAQDRQIGWHKLREKLDPAIVFLIGVMPQQLGISASFRLNEPNNFNDRMWLPTLDLRDLEKFGDVKKQLWINGMKPLFVDKPIPVCPGERNDD